MATYFPVQALTIVWAGWRTEMDGTAHLDVHFSHRMQKSSSHHGWRGLSSGGWYQELLINFFEYLSNLWSCFAACERSYR